LIVFAGPVPRCGATLRFRSENVAAPRAQLPQRHCRVGLSRHPIASIARGWGLTDPSSFTRMFKNAYGMSPREWRHQANTRRSEPTGEFINQ
jgi:AraC-like DNA-binding protein